MVGLKPTYGAVSRYGVVAFASSLDQVGPFALTVRDVAQLLAIIARDDPRDSTNTGLPGPVELPVATDLKGLRLAVPRDQLGVGVEPGVAELFERPRTCAGRSAPRWARRPCRMPLTASPRTT